MSVLRALAVLAITILPSPAATFGTVVTHPAPLADLALDDVGRLLYAVNTAQNTVEVYRTNTNPPTRLQPINTAATPLAVALSRNRQLLYVACYGASALQVID